MKTVIQDLRIGIRMMIRTPAFTAAAIITLALGIGANTAIFSLLNAILWKGVPAVDAAGLVSIYSKDGDDGLGVSSFMDYQAFRSESRTFADLAAWKARGMDLGSDLGSERIEGMMVSHSYFPTLEVRPALGRFFQPTEDDDPGAETVVVLSHSLWQRLFAGDPLVVGQSLHLNGKAFTIIGVAAEGFHGSSLLVRPQVFVPMAMQPHFMPSAGNLLGHRGWSGIELIGRLAPGTGMEQAQRELETMGQALAEAYPRFNAERTYRAFDLRTSTLPPSMRSNVARVGLLLAGLVAIVLLVACANVASLLMARASRRRKEIAVRRAIGASRLQLVRALLAENLLLALAGSALGLLIAMWAGDALVRLEMPLYLDLALDQRVLAYAAGMAVVATLLFGLMPALRATGRSLSPALTGRSSDRRHARRWRLRHALIVGQVSLSLFLAIVAGLCIRTLGALARSDPGFDADQVLIATLDPSLQGYSGAQTGAFYMRLLEETRGIPGVSDVTFSSAVLGPDNDGVITARLRGFPSPDGSGYSVGEALVGPDYFETLRIPIVEGRAFEASDRGDGQPVVIINETAARWISENTGLDALQHGISIDGPEGPFMDVIGVAADTKITSMRAEPYPFIYRYLPQAAASGDATASLVVIARTAGPAVALGPELGKTVARLDANLPVQKVSTMREQLETTFFQERLIAFPLSLAAILALVLAAVGLSGLLAYAVSIRSREIGVRTALGARRGSLLAMVIKEGLTLTSLGIAIGLAGAVAGTRVLERFLYGVSSVDPSTFAIATGLMLAVALIASYLPARAATRVDPVIALRGD